MSETSQASVPLVVRRARPPRARKGKGKDLAFAPATAPLEVVWDWLCEKVPGLRESPGLGVPPNDQAGPVTYCEANLYHLLEQALGLMPVWSCTSLSAFAPADECWVIVDIRGGYTLGDIVAPSGRGEARCAWGDPEREPTKEARLRAAADLVFRVSREKKLRQY